MSVTIIVEGRERLHGFLTATYGVAEFGFATLATDEVLGETARVLLDAPGTVQPYAGPMMPVGDVRKAEQLIAKARAVLDAFANHAQHARRVHEDAARDVLSDLGPPPDGERGAWLCARVSESPTSKEDQ